MSKPIPELSAVDKRQFEQEIVPAQQPVVMRGLVKHWPSAQWAGSAGEFVQELHRHHQNQEVYTIAGQPDIDGRFFYGKGLRGVNYNQVNVKLGAVLDQLIAMADANYPHALAVQSAPVRSALPEFANQHDMPLLDAEVEPTMWIGNRARVAPHYDTRDNLAGVAFGRRKFTVFPPDQTPNLYLGPALQSPGGVPISLVDIQNPDYERFPKYRFAEAESMSALLEPGDVIYIPSPWWHAVQSLDAFNMLINYWWSEPGQSEVPPNHSLTHALITIASLSPAKRKAWKHIFDFCVFRDSGDAREYLPEDLNDTLTQLSPEQAKMVRQLLKESL